MTVLETVIDVARTHSDNQRWQPRRLAHQTADTGERLTAYATIYYPDQKAGKTSPQAAGECSCSPGETVGVGPPPRRRPRAEL